MAERELERGITVLGLINRMCLFHTKENLTGGIVRCTSLKTNDKDVDV